MTRGLYQYETSPRKLEPSYKPRKKQSIKVLENPKANKKTLQSQKKRQTKMTLTIVAIFAVLLTISYRNSQINEKFNKVQTLKREWTIKSYNRK